MQRESGDPASGNGQPPGARDWVRAAVGRYERPLVSYAHDLTGSLDRARDIVQETFVRLCGADRAEVEPRLAHWLFTVARNLAIDHRRKERRMSLIDDTTTAPLTETFTSRALPPDDAAERDDSLSAVLKSLASLPPVQQEVVRLKFQHGLSYKEIGAVLNLTVTNVGFILHTALKTLRTRLGETDPIKLRS
jgi:RNA polymerase sigma-70 factor (ECF subfamily)